MPSSATITAFYNFSANTKARASQVNNNFDIFRGHVIPVHVSTATSANNTYNLGSSEYLWANTYATNQYLNGNQIFGLTTTKQVIVQMDGATTAAEAVVKINGTEKFRVTANGYVGSSGRTFGLTSSAGLGQMAVSTGFTTSAAFNNTSTTTPMPGSTCTIQSSGRPILIRLIHSDIANSGTAYITVSQSATSDLGFGAHVYLWRAGGSTYQGSALFGNRVISTSTADLINLYWPPGSISWIDHPNAGTHTYELYYRTFIAGQMILTNCRVAAIEL